MPTARPLEYCFVCDEPTGRAGQGDGSLYCECDKGPFCEDCWSKHHNADTKVAEMLAALRRIGYMLHDVPLNIQSIARHAIDKAKGDI